MPEVIQAAIANRLASVNVALPGRIESYDPITQRAKVQLLVRRKKLDDLGNPVTEAIAPLNSVPVQFPSAGAYSITWPISRGDLVLVVFCSGSIDKWLVGDGREVDPADSRKFTLSDAVAIPGLHTFRAPLANAATNAMTIAAPATVVASAAIKLGSATATDTVMRKSDAELFMTALDAAITATVGVPIAQAALNALKSGLVDGGWIAGIDSLVKAD